MSNAAERLEECRLAPGVASSRSTIHKDTESVDGHTQDAWEHRRTFIISPIQVKNVWLHIPALASPDISRSSGTGGGCRHFNGLRELYFRQGVNLALFLGGACGDSGCGSSIPPFSGSLPIEELSRATEPSRSAPEGFSSAECIGAGGSRSCG